MGFIASFFFKSSRTFLSDRFHVMLGISNPLIVSIYASSTSDS